MEIVNFKVDLLKEHVYCQTVFAIKLSLFQANRVNN